MWYHSLTPSLLDCGAGIGRVSKRLLLPLFREVDLIEQNPLFLERSQEYLVSQSELLVTTGHFYLQGEAFKRVGKSYPLGLQEFVPEEGRYDLVWCQWVLSHLRDGEGCVGVYVVLVECLLIR